MTLGPEARELIDSAEGVDSPHASDKERVRARLAASIGASIVGVAATGAAAKSVSTVTAMAKGAGGGAIGTTLLAKVLAVFAVGAAVSIGYVAGRRSETDATHRTPPEPTVVATGNGAPIATPPPTVVTTAVAPAGGEQPAQPSEHSGDVPLAPAPGRPAHIALPSPHGQPTAAATAPAPAMTTTAAPHSSTQPDGVGEAALLQRARTAIDSGDGVTALDALDAHERRFPGGLLADQRQAERVVALCTIAKGATTRERAEHFLAQRPRSQQADRIRRACGIP